MCLSNDQRAICDSFRICTNIWIVDRFRWKSGCEQLKNCLNFIQKLLYRLSIILNDLNNHSTDYLYKSFGNLYLKTDVAIKCGYQTENFEQITNEVGEYFYTQTEIYKSTQNKTKSITPVLPQTTTFRTRHESDIFHTISKRTPYNHPRADRQIDREDRQTANEECLTVFGQLATPTSC